MGGSFRRTEKELTPAQKADRLAEHRASKAVRGRGGLSIRSALIGKLGQDGYDQLVAAIPTIDRPKRRQRRGRGRKVAA